LYRRKTLFFSMALLMVVFGSCSCEEKDKLEFSNKNDKPEAPKEEDKLEVLEILHEYDIHLPEGALKLVDADGSPYPEAIRHGQQKYPDTFISRNGLRWSLENSEFDTESLPEDFVLIVNGKRFPSDNLVIEKHLLTANLSLADGRNDVSLKAWDKVGRTLYYEAILWAGNNTIIVSLVNPDGTPFTPQTNVVASIADDPNIAARVVTSNGTATLVNIPDRTILIEAKGANNELGSVGMVGSQKAVKIHMLGFNAPVENKNHNFSKGTEGWIFSPGAYIKLIPYEEKIPGFFSSASNSASMMQHIAESNSISTQNLLIGTKGIGEQSASYTFTTEPDTTGVKIRYRFITSEVPGGYYGTKYNDYFRVSIRSQSDGGNIHEMNSMNGLGLEAFNAAGETDWREHTLIVDRKGDTIQVDMAVANVADGKLDSQVVIAFIEEIKEQVRPALAWNSQQGGLSLTWEVIERPLTQNTTIDVHFANGSLYGNRLGTSVFSHTLPAGTQPGTGGPVRIDGLQLRNAPNETTHLIALSSPSQVGSVPDVSIAYGANADRTTVDNRLVNIIKEGQRVNGVNNATITSTLRTPADQARVMFNNIRNTGVQAQLNLYAAAGRAVIQVYVNQTAGMTPEEIGANAMAIRGAMEAEINNQGPNRVSNHCGDPATTSVVDVAYGNLGALFVNDVTPRVARFLDEPQNRCYHLEFNR